MNDSFTVSVRNLTKTYRIFGHPGDWIKQALSFGRVRFYLEFTALQGVSFEIKKAKRLENCRRQSRLTSRRLHGEMILTNERI